MPTIRETTKWKLSEFIGKLREELEMTPDPAERKLLTESISMAEGSQSLLSRSASLYEEYLELYHSSENTN